MKLKKITAWVVRVNLLDEWASSPEFGKHGTGNPATTLLRFEDENGNEGWGESAGNRLDALEKISGTLLAQDWNAACPNLLDLYAPGELYWQKPAPPSPYANDRANLRHRLRHPLQPIVECALLDLRARTLGCPLGQLLGGIWRTEVAVDYWAGRSTPEQAARCAKRGKELGFKGIKLKTTLEDPDPERFEAIKDAVGGDFKITLDPNGRYYRLDDALQRILTLDRIGNLSILEDPFPRFHLDEFAALRKRINARVVVHIDPPESFWNVITSGGAGGLNIDSHTIGPSQWRILAGAAEQANLSIWHGSGNDLGISTATQLHLAASAPNCRLPGDQAGPWLREATLVKEPFVVRNGGIVVPTGPGIGVTPDLDAIDKHTIKSAYWENA